MAASSISSQHISVTLWVTLLLFDPFFWISLFTTADSQVPVAAGLTKTALVTSNLAMAVWEGFKIQDDADSK